MWNRDASMLKLEAGTKKEPKGSLDTNPHHDFEDNHSKVMGPKVSLAQSDGLVEFVEHESDARRAPDVGSSLQSHLVAVQSTRKICSTLEHSIFR
jgi:hypothetical protein